jgi:hypothetical protein
LSFFKDKCHPPHQLVIIQSTTAISSHVFHNTSWNTNKYCPLAVNVYVAHCSNISLLHHVSVAITFWFVVHVVYSISQIGAVLSIQSTTAHSPLVFHAKSSKTNKYVQLPVNI